MSQIELTNSIALTAPGAAAESTSATQPAHPRTELRITASDGWRLINVRELWRFRELLYFFVWRDVKVRYKQTFLGIAWAVLQPAMMMLAFTVFLKRMAGVNSGEMGPPYPVFVYSGLLPWMFFSTSITQSANSVISSEKLVTKIYFPRLAIPLASVGSAGVDFLVAMLLLIALMAGYRVSPAWSIFLAPLVLLVIGMTALGIGTFIAALTVSYRDFKYVLPFAVQFWMFATPSIYTDVNTSRMGGLRALLALNPMTGLVSAFRAACLGGTIHWGEFGLSALCGAVLLIGGCLYFRKKEDSFADLI